MEERNNLIEELKWRNIVKDITDNDKLNQLIKEKGTFYLGIDPTGNSLHLGHYISVNLVRIFSKYNLEPILVMGGATGSIGDPSFKASERKLLTLEEVNHNIKLIELQLKKYLKEINFKIVNNYDFYKNMNVLTFLRDIGKQYNIATMIHRESIASRIESGLSFTEFSYSLLQGYDFFRLYEDMNCKLQIGGSDQWANILSGIDLIKKKYFDSKAVGLTIHLLVDENNNKFGKTSEGKTIFCNKDLTSVYEMYQFLINQSDIKAEELIKKLTLINKDQFDNLKQKHLENSKLHYFQKYLANDLISIIHSQEELKKVIKISNLLFEEKYLELNKEEILEIIKDFQVIKIEPNLLFNDLLVNNKVINSKREYRDFIKQGTIKVNGTKIEEEQFSLNNDFFLFKKFCFVKIGKHKQIIFTI